MLIFFFQRALTLLLLSLQPPLCAEMCVSPFTFCFDFFNAKYLMCLFWQKVLVMKEEIKWVWSKLLGRHIQDGTAMERSFYFAGVAYRSSYQLNEHGRKHMFFLGLESKCGLRVQGLLPVWSARVVWATVCQLSFTSCVPGPINSIFHSSVISPGGYLVLMGPKMGGTGPYRKALWCRGSCSPLQGLLRVSEVAVLSKWKFRGRAPVLYSWLLQESLWIM